MKVAIVGIGYVGLVTGTCLAEIGHEVTCIDIDVNKVNELKKGISPIYEPGLEELLEKNIASNHLSFTNDYNEGLNGKEIVYIAVGTPENDDGSTNLKFVESVANSIAEYAENDIIVVTKSTVPVGTNHYVQELIENNKKHNINIDIVSNPEFLREGSAIKDTFNGDRIVIGADNLEAAEKITELNEPFGISIYQTDIKSAEMIKYASNAFLATKISYINEIANISEEVGANVKDVAKGMGMDPRIGPHFLNAGIGYGGSCFPKDTKSLIKIAERYGYDFKILKQVVEVNELQPLKLVEKVKQHFGGNINGRTIGVLGLAFKPNTDDMREAPSIKITESLIELGATVKAYDPVALENAKSILNTKVDFQNSAEDATNQVDAVLLVTEWQEFKSLDYSNQVVFDGRNFLKDVVSHNDYYSIG